MFTFFLGAIAYAFILQINEFTSSCRYACSNCWLKVETFHDFHIMVEANHQNRLINEIDTKTLDNPLIDCETSIKIESDRFDTITSNYETVYVPSTFSLDDSNTQNDQRKSGNSTTVAQQFSDPNLSSAASEESILLQVKVEKNVQSTKPRIRTRAIENLKSISRETINRKSKSTNQDIETIGGVM